MNKISFLLLAGSFVFAVMTVPASAQNVVMKAIEFDLTTFNAAAGECPFYINLDRLAIKATEVAYRTKWATATKNFPGTARTYDIVFSSMYEGDGESKYALKVNSDSIGGFQNPSAWTGNTQTIKDYTIYKHTYKGVKVPANATIKVYAMCNSNGKVPEGSAFAWSRGRWTQLEFVPGSTSVIQGPARQATPAAIVYANNNLSFSAPSAGSYTVNLYSVSGKLLATRAIAAAGKVSTTVSLTGFETKGTFIVDVKGTGYSANTLIIR